MTLPFPPTIAVATQPLLPVEAFPAHMRDRAAKLPMHDADRDVMIMRIEQKREYLVRLRQTLQERMDLGSATVQGVHEGVPVAALLKRHMRQTEELLWEGMLIIRNDLLLEAADVKWGPT